MRRCVISWRAWHLSNKLHTRKIDERFKDRLEEFLSEQNKPDPIHQERVGRVTVSSPVVGNKKEIAIQTSKDLQKVGLGTKVGAWSKARNHVVNTSSVLVNYCYVT